jgi:hypothetical protein
MGIKSRLFYPIFMENELGGHALSVTAQVAKEWRVENPPYRNIFPPSASIEGGEIIFTRRQE